MKIRLIFIILMSIFSVAGMIVGITAIHFSRMAMEDTVIDANIILTENALGEIDREFYHNILLFQTLSDTPFLQEFIAESNKSFDSMEDPIAYINKMEQIWVDSNSDNTRPEIKQILENKLSRQLLKTQMTLDKGFGQVSEIIITNTYGSTIATTGKTSDYLQSDEHWWQEAKEKKIHIDDVNYDESAGVYSVDVSTRIDDADGNFVGVRKVVWNFSTLVSEINKLSDRLPSDSKFILTTSDSKVIFSTNPFVIKQKTPYDFYPNTNSGSFYTNNSLNVVTYSVSNGFRDYPGLGWILFYDNDRKTMFSDINKIENEILFLMISSLSISVGLSYVLTQKYNARLKNLNKVTKEIAKGNYTLTIIDSSDDEIGELSRNICKMGDAVMENQKQLIQKEKLEIVGRMAERLAHDIRNPLSVIKNGIEIIKSDPKKIEKIKPMISQAISRITHQTDDVLMFLRVSKIEFSANSVKEILLCSIPTMGKEINLKLPSDDFIITCDAKRLSTVFSNILHNAIKALDGKAGTISIDFQDKEEFLKISISNTGPEINSRNIERIFDPLFTTQQEGTGLGLTTCKLIVERHGGTITVSNNPVTFTITIPKKMRALDKIMVK